MLITDFVRLFLSTLLAVQIFTGTLQVWMVYVYAAPVTGVMGGLFGPASMSIVPHIVPEEDLQAGNSLTQGSSSLIGFIGPAIAGAMIAAFANESTGMGIAIAVGCIDLCGFSDHFMDDAFERNRTYCARTWCFLTAFCFS